MTTRDLSANSTQEFIDKSVDKPVIYGKPDAWILICKVSSSSMMKSTKAMNLPNGAVIQVSTNEDGQVAEALCFVPGVNFDSEGERIVLD